MLCPCVVGWDMAASLDESCFMALLPGTSIAMRTKTRTLGGIKVLELSDKKKRFLAYKLNSKLIIGAIRC